jgi:hypothetical protein
VGQEQRKQKCFSSRDSSTSRRAVHGHSHRFPVRNGPGSGNPWLLDLWKRVENAFATSSAPMPKAILSLAFRVVLAVAAREAIAKCDRRIGSCYRIRHIDRTTHRSHRLETGTIRCCSDSLGIAHSPRHTRWDRTPQVRTRRSPADRSHNARTVPHCTCPRLTRPLQLPQGSRRVAALQPFDASVTRRPLPNREAAIRKRSKIPVDSAVYQSELRDGR